MMFKQKYNCNNLIVELAKEGERMVPSQVSEIEAKSELFGPGQENI